MGYSTVEIDIKRALKISSGWTVVAASRVSDFDPSEWEHNIAKAEKVEGQNRIFFTLKNTDFVEVEK